MKTEGSTASSSWEKCTHALKSFIFRETCHSYHNMYNIALTNLQLALRLSVSIKQHGVCLL